MKTTLRPWLWALSGFVLLVVAIVLIGFIRSMGHTSSARSEPTVVQPPLTPLIEAQSTVGPELTEGQATAWTNGQKIAVDSQGRIHVVYQYEAPFDEPGTIVYASSPDGTTWIREAWSGRYPTIAVGPDDRVYLVYVERSQNADYLWLRWKDPQSDWQSRQLLEAPSRSLFYPALVVGREALHLVWESHQPQMHAIHYLRFPWKESLPTATITPATVVSGDQGVFFPSLAEDGQGELHLVWETSRDGMNHRLDAAVRTSAGRWVITPDLMPSVADAGSASLSLSSTREILLTFVAHESQLKSALYVLRYANGRWEKPDELEYQGKMKGAAYDQPVVAFPAQAAGLILWGHTVPAACGTGPLYWAYQNADGQWSDPQPLTGDFASFPQLVERPRGVWHILWTDRDAKALRAFEVRYLKLDLH